VAGSWRDRGATVVNCGDPNLCYDQKKTKKTRSTFCNYWEKRIKWCQMQEKPATTIGMN
jgi:hypothetical protein